MPQRPIPSPGELPTRPPGAASDSLLAAIVDSSDDAIISKTLDGVITSWNRGAERIFGYTATEMIGRRIEVLFPPDRLQEEPKILEQLRRGDRVEHFQTIRVRKDGTKIPISVTISPVKDATGRIVGASKVARDVTREQEALRKLDLANQELKRADQMKSEFLALMSHELRTPLNSIIGFAGVLRRGMLADGQKKQVDSIYSSGTHLLHLINDILDLSRIEAGRMEVEMVEFAVDDAIRDAIRMLEIQATQKGVKLVHEPAEGIQARTDRKRFLQLLLNLLGNAIKFTPSGTVTVAASRRGDDVVVAVTDTGIGIAEDKQSFLFKPFNQLEGAFQRRFEGTGLGLYLCRKIVDLLGGRIWLESAAGRGATFTFSIPTRMPANNAAPELSSLLQ